MKNHFLLIIAIFLFTGTILTGCATTETEHMLAASGFTVLLADTPEKLKHLKTMDQNTFFLQERHGQSYHVYADADHCKCLYIGDTDNYQKYEQLSDKQEIAEGNVEDWGPWPPWGPWGDGTHR